MHYLTVSALGLSYHLSSHTSPTSYIINNTDVSPLKLSEVPDVHEVVERISHLDSHKAVGIDGIPTKYVKASPLCMAVLLTKLINKSISSAVFANSKITQWFFIVQFSSHFSYTIYVNDLPNVISFFI